MLKEDNKIYDVYLVSVSKSAKIDPDDSVSNNISRAIRDNEVSLLTRVLVKMMPYDDLFREILSGKIIPGCISYTDWRYRFTHEQKLSNYLIDSYAFIKPLYIKLPIAYIGYREDIYDKLLIGATSDRIDEYIKENIDVMDHMEKLDGLFEEARQRYEQASSNYTKYSGNKYRKLVREK